MNDVTIDKEAFLSLWKLDELPACDEGMELARRFLLRAGEAVDKLDQTDVIATRNALIRAHKELTGHRSECPKCNEVDMPVHPLIRGTYYERTGNSNHHEDRSWI